MVPVFIAPKPEKKKDEEEAAPKKLTAKNLLVGLGAVILLAVAVGFFIKNQPEAIQQNKNPEPPPVINSGIADANRDKANDANAAPPPVVEKPLTVSEERDPALALMSSAAQDQGHNRSRPLCDRIVAHTAADCGNLEIASKFLEPLKNAENGLSFYRVGPLTAIAWWHLKSGDKAAAEKNLDESSKTAADLPVEGIFSIDAAAWLAAALTAERRVGTPGRSRGSSRGMEFVRHRARRSRTSLARRAVAAASDRRRDLCGEGLPRRSVAACAVDPG
jgi:hypothetical protein